MLKMPAYYQYTSREDRSMYKNISFQEAEFGEKKFLMYYTFQMEKSRMPGNNVKQ